VWREYEIPMKDDEIVTHGDAGPWNVVYRDGMPVGLIDWDGARPRRPIDDLASIAWNFVPLGPDEDLQAQGFRPPFQTAGRLRLLCAAYGLNDRAQLLPALSTVRQLGVEKLRYWQPLRPAVGARHLRATAADLEWLGAVEPELREALGLE
jgi:aminoglycoside phosphotransferase (APT) family kinase protein